MANKKVIGAEVVKVLLDSLAFDSSVHHAFAMDLGNNKKKICAVLPNGVERHLTINIHEEYDKDAVTKSYFWAFAEVAYDRQH